MITTNERSIGHFLFFLLSRWKFIFVSALVFSAIFFSISLNTTERFLTTTFIQIESKSVENIKPVIQHSTLQINDSGFQSNQVSELHRMFINIFRDSFFLNDFIRAQAETLDSISFESVSDLAKQRRSFLKVATITEGREKLLLEITSMSENASAIKKFQHDYVQAVLREIKRAYSELVIDAISRVEVPPNGSTTNSEWKTKIPLVNFETILIMSDSNPRTKNLLEKNCKIEGDFAFCSAIDFQSLIRYVDPRKIEKDFVFIDSPSELLREFAYRGGWNDAQSESEILIDIIVDKSISVGEIMQRKEGRQFDHFQQGIFGFLVGIGIGLSVVSGLFANIVKRS